MEHILWLNNFNKLNKLGLENVNSVINKIKIKRGRKYYRFNNLNRKFNPIPIESIPLKNCIIFAGNPDIPDHSLCKLNDIIERLRENECFHEFKYSIILIPTDKTIQPEEIPNIPSCVKSIHLTNINYEHPIIKFIPLGIDQRNKEYLNLMNNNLTKNRHILCYCNFSLNTHEDRRVIYSMVKNKDFIFKESMGTYQNYYITREDFFKRLNDSKFVLCPRGNGLDTHRFYETLYCGAIPIVIKEHFHEQYTNLPILFLDNIEQFETLTKDFLEEQYNKLKVKFRDYYPEIDLKQLLFDIFQ